MVREVGFEPTNPYGTGASGLRVQDPFSHHRVSLTWLGNTSRRKQRTPAHLSQTPLPQTANPVQAVNWLSPARHTRSKNRKMFNSSPTHPRDKPRPCLSSATRRNKTTNGHKTSQDKTP